MPSQSCTDRKLDSARVTTANQSGKKARAGGGVRQLADDDGGYDVFFSLNSLAVRTNPSPFGFRYP